MKSFLRLTTLSSLALFAGPLVVRGQAQAAPQAAPECAEIATLKAQLDRARARLMDWAEMARYREANAQLAAPSGREHRVVFMGDSITDSWSRPAMGGFFPGKPYLNRGISGQTTPQMVVRFRQDVIALEPEAVIILAGTNDLAGNTGPIPLEATEGNLASMAELARAHGIRVVLASLLPVSDYGRRPDGTLILQTDRRPPAQILELNAWMKRFAAENGLIYLDYFAAAVDEQGWLKKEWSEDGLHPNAQGYAAMAPLAERAIQEAVKKKR